MRWFIPIAIVVQLIALFFPFCKETGDGAVPLTVVIRSDKPRSILRATVEAHHSRSYAERIQDIPLPPESPMWSAQQNPFVGRPLTVNVGTSRPVAHSLAWRYERYSQWEALLVVIHDHGGERKAKVVDVPDLRRVRHVVVDFP